MSQMNQNNPPATPNETSPALSNQAETLDDEIKLIDLIYPIYKRRKFLLMFCIFGLLTVGTITRYMPKTYEAIVLILPEPESKEQTIGSELKAAFLGKFGLSGFGETSSSPIPDLLESKELERVVRDRYNFYLIGVGKNFSVMGDKP